MNPSTSIALRNPAAFIDHVKTAAKFAARKHSMPILQRLKLTLGADGMSYRVEACDLESGYVSPSTVAEPSWTTCVHPKALLDILKGASSPLTLEALEGNILKIASAGRSATLLGIPEVEYPIWPPNNLDFPPTQELPQGFADAVAFAMVAVSREDFQPHLEGVCFEKTGHVVGCDGHRLHAMEISPLPFVAWPSGQDDIVLPLSGLKKLPLSEVRAVSVVGYVVRFMLKDGALVHVRTLDVTFPQWRQVLPKGEPVVKLSYDAGTMVAAVKRVAAVVRDELHREVQSVIASSGTHLSAKSTERGESSEDASCYVSGLERERVRLALNGGYWEDALNGMKGGKGKAAVEVIHAIHGYDDERDHVTGSNVITDAAGRMAVMMPLKID